MKFSLRQHQNAIHDALFFNALREHSNFAAYDAALKAATKGGPLHFKEYKAAVSKVQAKYAALLHDAREKAGMRDLVPGSLQAPYANGNYSEFQFGEVHGGATQTPDPVNGSVNSYALVDHSSATTVSVCAINIPAPDNAVIESIDLNIIYDMFAWATHGPNPQITYWVFVEGGTNNHDWFPLGDTFAYPPPYGNPTGLEDPNSYLNPVFPSGSYGGDPQWVSYWWGQAGNTVINSSETQSFDLHVPANGEWLQGVRLWAVVRAIGGNPQHSGGGGQVIATIQKINILQ